jgi:hypothetical protein
MNKCIFQYWEESERGYGVRPGGCSIHSSLEEHMNFINSIYSSRTDKVPQGYDSFEPSCEFSEYVDG